MMGGTFRVRRHIEQGQANRLALLVSQVDAQGRKEMAPFLEGTYRADDFLPQFRRSVKRLLAGDRLKPAQRRRLVEWGAEYGLQTHGGGEPLSATARVRLSPGQLERVKLSAAGSDTDVASWIREAVLQRLAREGGETR